MVLKRSSSRALLASAMFFVVALGSPGIRAEIAIHDAWNEEENLTLSTERWQARFRHGEDRFLFTSGDESVSIALLPVGAKNEQPLLADQCAATREEDGRVTVQWTLGKVNVSMSFSPYGALRLEAPEAMLRLETPVAVGVLPGIVQEDVFYRADAFSGDVTLAAENWFAGLIEGEGGILFCAWQDTDAPSRLIKGSDVFSAFDLSPASGEIFIELLAIPGIWRREILELGYLERETRLEWERPVPAVYRTQAPFNAETLSPRTVEFTHGPHSEWRPEIGDFTWPVYFDGNRAVLNYSKKVPPQGDMIAYPAHGVNESLRGFIARTPLNESIMNRNVRRSIPAGPRGVRNVGYNACWGTQLLRRTLYIQGRQYRERGFLREHADFLADYVGMVQRRNRLYLEFLEDTRTLLAGWANETEDPDISAWITDMKDRAENIEAGMMNKLNRYGHQLPEEHTAYAAEILERLKGLLETPGQELYPEFEEIINEVNILSWGNDEDTGMRFNMLASAWALEAAFSCADAPGLVPYVRALRAAIRDMLCGAAPW